MMPRNFEIYAKRNASLVGEIREDGSLHLVSEVFGEEYDSEKHYVFSKAETDRLLSLISLDEFIVLCRRDHLVGMESFLSKNGITYSDSSASMPGLTASTAKPIVAVPRNPAEEADGKPMSKRQNPSADSSLFGVHNCPELWRLLDGEGFIVSSSSTRDALLATEYPILVELKTKLIVGEAGVTQAYTMSQAGHILSFGDFSMLYSESSYGAQ